MYSLDKCSGGNKKNILTRQQRLVLCIGSKHYDKIIDYLTEEDLFIFYNLTFLSIYVDNV